MEIPNNLIEDAKKILGDRAAHIISSGLNLNKWDERNLKGCCPNHMEKTPSFIWYSKGLCFKCFGCGYKMDILDYYMSTGMDFLDAVRELFRETNTNYDFEEQNNKLKEKISNNENKPYRHPKEESELIEGNVLEYIKLRHISPQTAKYMGIKQDTRGNIVFEYKDQLGRHMLSKYRPARKVPKGELKTWCQKGADTAPVLYGMHQIDTTKPLLITEGELDRAAAIESGYKNTVSVPFGAGNYSWIEYNWEWLEQFSKIVVWSDNDDAGEKMRKEVVPRLGEERCYIVKGMYKDINVQLFIDGKESVLRSIMKAEEIPLPDTIDLFDAEDFDINKAEKIKSGYAGLDKWIGGFVLSTLNIVTGVNSSGKSTLINQMCISEPLEQGYKVWIYSGELAAPHLKHWVEYPLAGPRYIKEFDNGPNAPKGYSVFKIAKQKIKETYRDSVFYYSNELDSSISNILKRMEQVAKKKGVKVFLLDNLMMIDLECKASEIYQRQKWLIKQLKSFAMRFNCCVHLVAHPRKVEDVRRLNKMDIAGTGDITNMADYVISIHRVLPSEKENIIGKNGEILQEGCPFDAIVDLFKNRPLGYQDKAIGLHFNYPSKRFYGDSDNADKPYKWEQRIQNMDKGEELELTIEAIQEVPGDIPF